MNLEEEILADLGKQFAKDMDFEIMSQVLIPFGWTRFEIPRFIDNHHAIDIGYWLLDNCQGEYKRNGRVFLFKEPRDATMFILRWGS